MGYWLVNFCLSGDTIHVGKIETVGKGEEKKKKKKKMLI